MMMMFVAGSGTAGNSHGRSWRIRTSRDCYFQAVEHYDTITHVKPDLDGELICALSKSHQRGKNCTQVHVGTGSKFRLESRHDRFDPRPLTITTARTPRLSSWLRVSIDSLWRSKKRVKRATRSVKS